ncbi:MAG: hypothetical protein KGK33_13365 [Hyphomicrobiales bacterium]|nr:hypothetical protein [Hyphomicrobiales bacterium]
MTENDALDFVRTSIGSVWALELLVLLRREPVRSWPLDLMIYESRSSVVAVSHAIQVLENAGLVVKTAPREYLYQPTTPALDAIGDLVQKIYSTKPSTVISAIFDTPNDQLRTFARAFKFTE